jgi:dCTP deaminase
MRRNEMILTGASILQAWQRGTIAITPFDRANLNTNSYDFHLHPVLLVGDPRTAKWQRVRVPSAGIVLTPGKIYLGATAEIMGSTDYAMTLLGKSSVGRLGIFLNITADLGHMGSRSRWTLEITVIQPIRVYALMCIGQVAFWRAATGQAHAKKYRGRYSRQLRPEPSLDPRLLGGRR